MVHIVLHNALGYAARKEFVVRNVAALVDKPSDVDEEPSEKLNVWNEKEVATFLKKARNDRLEAPYILALTCGFRQGELLGLYRRCVNLKAGTVSIQQTLIEVKGKLTLKDPKTKTSRRLVNLPEVAVHGLRRHFERMMAEGHAGTEWVFCDSQGGPIQKSHLRRRSFKPLLEKAEVPEIRFHDLRHTAATLLLSLGVHPKVVQERLGHSTIRVTLDTYSHVLPSIQEEAVGRLNGMFNALG